MSNLAKQFESQAGHLDCKFSESLEKLRLTDTSLSTLTHELEQLATKLDGLREFEQFDPRNLSSFTAKRNYQVIKQHLAFEFERGRAAYFAGDGSVLFGGVEGSVCVWQTTQTPGEKIKRDLGWHYNQLSHIQF